MHVDPLLLLRAAETDKKQIRLGAQNSCANLLVIHFQKCVIRRRIITGQFQLWIFLPHFGDSLFQRFLRSTEEEGTKPLLCREFQEERDHIGARDAFRQRITKEPRSPNQRRPVAQHKMRIKKNPAQFNVVRGLYEEIDISGRQIMRPAGEDHLLDHADGFRAADVIEGDAEDRNWGGFGKYEFVFKLVHSTYRFWATL